MTSKALRALRLALGLSVADFAELLQLPVSDVFAWERGTAPVDVRRLSDGLERILSDQPSWAPAGTTADDLPNIVAVFDAADAVLQRGR